MMILFLLQPLKINSILSTSLTTNPVHHFIGLIDPDSVVYRLLWALKTQCSPEPLPWGHAKQALYQASVSLNMQATPHPRRPPGNYYHHIQGLLPPRNFSQSPISTLTSSPSSTPPYSPSIPPRI